MPPTEPRSQRVHNQISASTIAHSGTIEQLGTILSAFLFSKPAKISLSVAFVVSRQKETLEELG
jgi:hypothetical protein